MLTLKPQNDRKTLVSSLSLCHFHHCPHDFKMNQVTHMVAIKAAANIKISSFFWRKRFHQNMLGAILTWPQTSIKSSPFGIRCVLDDMLVGALETVTQWSLCLFVLTVTGHFAIVVIFLCLCTFMHKASHLGPVPFSELSGDKCSV